MVSLSHDLWRRMAQQYYEYANYKEEHVQEQKKLPKGACHSYIIIFQSVFYLIFNVSPKIFALDLFTSCLTKCDGN